MGIGLCNPIVLDLLNWTSLRTILPLRNDQRLEPRIDELEMTFLSLRMCEDIGETRVRFIRDPLLLRCIHS